MLPVPGWIRRLPRSGGPRRAGRVVVACLVAAALHAAAFAPPSAAQDAAPPPRGAVQGVVTSSSGSSGGGLRGIWIEVAGEAELSALTDVGGRYRLTAVPAGRQRLRVHGLGYRPLDLEVRIPAGDTLSLDLVLDPEPLRVRGIAVRADPVAPRLAPSDPAPDRRATVEPRILEAGPGLAEAGLGRLARGLPVDGGDDPNRVLLMRGSTADQKLVLLDGAPVYVPFHLGGLVPSFEPGLLASARHYVGGAPARYDGGLSYILDLRTRAPAGDGARASAHLDALGGGATVEGGLGEAGSLLLSGRGLHGGGGALFAGDAPPYGYGDLLARGDVRIGGGHRIAATGFWNRERVRLDTPPSGSDGEEPVAAPDVVRPDGARWGNGALSLRYRGGGEDTDLDVTVAGSRYHASLPLAHETPAVGRARTDRLRVAAELVRSGEDGVLRVGGSAEGVDHLRSARVLLESSLVEVRDRNALRTLSLFLDGTRRLAPSVRLRAGVRLDHFSPAGGLRLAPRLALTWLLTDQAALTLAAGRFHQLPRGGELEVRMVRADPAGVETGHVLFGPARADHLVLGLDQELTPSLRLDLEGFLKGFRDLPGRDGVLRSSGMDLRVVRESDALSGWLGYSLSWFWDPASGASAGTVDRFAGRHLLTAGVEGRLLPFLDGAARAAYGDGLPYTSIPFVDGADDGAGVGTVIETAGGGGREDASGTPDRIPTLDGFLRLELEARGDWSVGWKGRRVRLRPYVRVMNALSRRDALFYYFEPWRNDELRAVAERPVLPVVGLDVRIGGPAPR